jgi:hypothetical protein
VICLARLKVHGPVVDQVIDADGLAFEIQIRRKLLNRRGSN